MQQLVVQYSQYVCCGHFKWRKRICRPNHVVCTNTLTLIFRQTVGHCAKVIFVPVCSYDNNPCVKSISNTFGHFCKVRVILEDRTVVVLICDSDKQLQVCGEYEEGA